MCGLYLNETFPVSLRFQILSSPNPSLRDLCNLIRADGLSSHKRVEKKFSQEEFVYIFLCFMGNLGYFHDPLCFLWDLWVLLFSQLPTYPQIRYWQPFRTLTSFGRWMMPKAQAKSELLYKTRIKTWHNAGYSEIYLRFFPPLNVFKVLRCWKRIILSVYVQKRIALKKNKFVDCPILSRTSFFKSTIFVLK